MPVPWLQIVQWVPSILELSRELLNRSRRPVAATADPTARLAALEENDRRQTELLSRMAEQTAQLTAAVTVLHRQTRWLIIGQFLAAGIALLAMIIAVGRGTA